MLVRPHLGAGVSAPRGSVCPHLGAGGFHTSGVGVRTSGVGVSAPRMEVRTPLRAGETPPTLGHPKGWPNCPYTSKKPSGRNYLLMGDECVFSFSARQEAAENDRCCVLQLQVRGLQGVLATFGG